MASEFDPGKCGADMVVVKIGGDQVLGFAKATFDAGEQVYDHMTASTGRNRLAQITMGYLPVLRLDFSQYDQSLIERIYCEEEGGAAPKKFRPTGTVRTGEESEVILHDPRDTDGAYDIVLSRFNWKSLPFENDGDGEKIYPAELHFLVDPETLDIGRIGPAGGGGGGG